MLGRITVWALSFLVVACDNGAVRVDTTRAYADTVISNAKFYTVNHRMPWADAVAIADGRYIYVGDAQRVAQFVGPDTDIIDLQGRMAMPGINDTHAHSWQGGTKSLYECNFGFSATPAEIAAIVQSCVAATESGTWITGGQWTSTFFDDHDIGSPREWLDQYSGDKAIYFEDDATHNAWVNSKALQLAGISRETENPDGGEFVRDADGNPNGLVFETAKPIIEAAIPVMTQSQDMAAIAEAVRLANAFGLTGINEARTPPDVSAAYRRLDNDGRLTVYAITNMQTPRGQRDTAFDVAELLDVAERNATTHVHTMFAKFFSRWCSNSPQDRDS